jgi:hypothetical protein
LLSTRVTSAFAARHRHDLVGGQPLAGMAAQARKPRRARLFTDLDQDNTAVPGATP